MTIIKSVFITGTLLLAVAGIAMLYTGLDLSAPNLFDVQAPSDRPDIDLHKLKQ